MNTQISHLAFIFLLTTSLSAQQRERTPHWQARNKLFEEAKSSVAKNGYVFLGNSITEGFNLEQYFPEWPVVNRGIVGDHIDGFLQRLDNSAIDLKPSRLYLLVGINDIGDRRNDDYLKKMYTILIDTLTILLPKTEFYLHSILPTSARWKNCPPDQIKRMNLFLKTLARKKHITFVDLHPHYIDESGYLKQNLTRDGLHLNSDGYKIWADILKKKRVIPKN